MQSSSELLIKKILDELDVLSAENKSILQKLYDNSILDKEQSSEIKVLREKVFEQAALITQIQTRIEIIEKSRTEISGFAKYSKLIWTALVAISSYLITMGLLK